MKPDSPSIQLKTFETPRISEGLKKELRVMNDVKSVDKLLTGKTLGDFVLKNIRKI